MFNGLDQFVAREEANQVLGILCESFRNPLVQVTRDGELLRLMIVAGLVRTTKGLVNKWRKVMVPG